MQLAFLLPARAGGGGVHSIVQEACELPKFGANVQILVPETHATSFRLQYPRAMLQEAGLRTYDRDDQIVELIRDCDLVVATLFTSVQLLADACDQIEESSRPRAAYYIQDYEPLFCAPGSQPWEQANRSYTLLERPLLFAKTRWLCAQVAEYHRQHVEKVEPSIDHTVYLPDLSVRQSTPTLCAMVRPSTPRRAPKRTVRMFNWLAETMGEQVLLHLFGCDQAALQEAQLTIHPSVQLHGFLRREEVAEVLRASDFFLDLSDYQAFGRTGVEAMACGCVPLMPMLGGASEFVEDGINGFLVDTRSDEKIMATVQGALELSRADRQDMALAAIDRASRLTVRRAALSEYRIFARALE